MPIARTAIAVVAAALMTSTTAAIAQRLGVDLTGKWALTVVTENGTGNSTLTIRQTGDSLSGTYESARMGTLAFKGTTKDSTFTFTIGTDGGAALTFRGVTVDADHIKGDVDFGGMGGATFTGARQK